MSGSVNEEPQRLQNFARGGLSNLHLAQRRSNAAPHSMQKLAFSGFSEWQLGQRIHPPRGALTLDCTFIYHKYKEEGAQIGPVTT
jgi:hypothetical protein